jgi:hypothetical protein
VRLAAAAVALAVLAPPIVAAPESPPRVVTVAVGADRATGFVAGDARVVTVAHVLEPGRPVVAGGRPAIVVRADPRLDLAVLHVPGVRGEAPLAATADPARVLTPQGERPAQLVRRITARVDGANPRPALELRAHVGIGDSGAPVVTSTGRVAGVVFARSRAREGTAYAVDAGVLETLRPLD